MLRQMVWGWVLVYSVSASALEVDELNLSNSFLTPTRLKQSPHDTPASVTKITAETIRDLQLNDVTDLFRYVAGMITRVDSGNDVRVNYHGTNGLIPRRLQVYLDGISVYRQSYAKITWPALPISVADIEEVEITRSPSAATYGANSMMAVINIKTKDPLSVSQLGAIAKVGGRGKQDGELYGSGEISATTRYRISASDDRNNGFDKNAVDETRRDGTRARRGDLKVESSLSSALSEEFFLAYSDALTELEYRDSGQQSFPDITTKSAYLNSTTKYSSQKNELSFKFYHTRIEQQLEWNTCYPAIMFSKKLHDLYLQNPDYAKALLNGSFPSGGSDADNQLRNAVLAEYGAMGSAALVPTCGVVNESGVEKKFDAELQDTLILSERLRFVGGLGAQRKTLDSETFLDGFMAANEYRLFGNAEYRLSRFVFNLGGMAEREPNYLDGTNFSPRVGANYHLTDDSTLRFVLSKSKRKPDVFEKAMDWSYTMHDMSPAYPTDGRTASPFYISAKGSPDIQSEQIISREVSYYVSDLTNLTNGFVSKTYDIKFYHDSLDDLVSEKLQFQDFHPSNNGAAELHGAEVDADFLIKSTWLAGWIEKTRLHFNYAYIDNQTDTFYERSLSPRHSGAMYSVLHHPHGWFSSVSYFGNSAMVNETMDVVELGLGRTIPYPDAELTLKGKVQYCGNNYVDYSENETQNRFLPLSQKDHSYVSSNDSASTFYFTVEYSLK